MIITPTSNEKGIISLPDYFTNIHSIRKQNKYILCTEGVNTDNLYFFNTNLTHETIEKNKIEIKTLSSDVYDNYYGEDEFLFADTIPEKLNVWHKFADIKEKANTQIYIRPKEIIDLVIADTLLLKDDEQPEKPLFSLFTDPFGNFVLKRVIYTERKNHEKYVTLPIQSDQVPNELTESELKDFGIDQLSYNLYVKEKYENLEESY